MTRIIPTTLIAVAVAAVVSAQSYPPAQSDTKRGDKKMSSSKTVALTGCLREGDQLNTFVLADVDASALGMHERGTTPAAPGTTGTAGTAAKTTVRLIGGGSVNLKDHVGHKVEITGMLVPQGRRSGRTTGTTGDTTSRTPGATPTDTDHPRLNVRSLKHIAGTCTP